MFYRDNVDSEMYGANKSNRLQYLINKYYHVNVVTNIIYLLNEIELFIGIPRI